MIDCRKIEWGDPEPLGQRRPVVMAQRREYRRPEIHSRPLVPVGEFVLLLVIAVLIGGIAAGWWWAAN